MKTSILPLVLGFLSTIAASAQVPQIINYQGKITVSGAPFTGNGQFKFALVDGTGATTYWSHDGSSSAGSEPTSAITLPVANGLYVAPLGDTGIGGMSAINSSVFTHADVRVRVWFNDGTQGSQLLSPDQRITSVGYAMTAASVPDGTITAAKIASGAVGSAQLATGAVQSANIAPNAVGSTQLAAGAAAANLNASGMTGVSSGGVVLSTSNANASLTAAGYTLLGGSVSSEGWRICSASSLAGRQGHTAIWTGTEMIVWGGRTGSYAADGARYNPTTNTWTALPSSGLAGRQNHTGIWTGTEMIIWGGINGSTYYSDGARYNPTTNTWTALPSSGLAGRQYHTAIWTGTEMIIWGGYTASGVVADGARYNPTTNTWTTLPSSGLAGRYGHTAIWTGTEMIVWGGNAYADGARYNPTTNVWTALPSSGLAGRQYHTAIWTGTEMIVWGGSGVSYYADGARYNPTTNTWTALPSPGLAGRVSHTAIWTGTEMIVWGGAYNDTSTHVTHVLGDGARFASATNNWAQLTPSLLSVRTGHMAVWTGTEMIVWGGSDGAYNAADGARYNPGSIFYLYVKP